MKYCISTNSSYILLYLSTRCLYPPLLGVVATLRVFPLPCTGFLLPSPLALSSIPPGTPHLQCLPKLDLQECRGVPIKLTLRLAGRVRDLILVPGLQINILLSTLLIFVKQLYKPLISVCLYVFLSFSKRVSQFQVCLKGISKVIYGHLGRFKGVSMVFQGYLKCFSRVSQWCLKGVLVVSQE